MSSADGGRRITALAAGGSVLLLSATAVALWPRTYGTAATFEGNRMDYRGSLNYQFTDDFMTYASVSTGYKGGDTNPRATRSRQRVLHHALEGV